MSAASEIILETTDNEEKSQIFPNSVEHDLFKCFICNIHSKYNYYGTRPLERLLISKSPGELTSEQKNYLVNSAKKENVILLEKCFVCDDPFSQTKASNYLILGAKCFHCDKMVCVGSECSIFYYKKRFCVNCVKLNMDQFPKEIITEILKLLK